MVSAVRKSLRDLLEVILLTLFLNNDVNRTYQKLGELSLRFVFLNLSRGNLTNGACSLPFTDDNDCALGIAVLTYLDHVALQDDSSSPTAKAASKAKGGSEWFLHITSFEDNLEKAFRLWDHVSLSTQRLCCHNTMLIVPDSTDLHCFTGSWERFQGRCVLQSSE